MKRTNINLAGKGPLIVNRDFEYIEWYRNNITKTRKWGWSKNSPLVPISIFTFVILPTLYFYFYPYTEVKYF